MIYLSQEVFERYKESLIKNKMKFDIYQNNSSSRIVDNISGDKFTGDRIERRYLYFISKVKKHVKEKIDSGLLKPDSRKRFHIDYFHFSVQKNKLFKDCYEVDVNSAYWVTAYKLGIISRAIFTEGNKITERSKDTSLSEEERAKIKAIRLMALGSLAKRTTHFHFNGKKMVRKTDIFDKKTEFFWNEICSHTATLMKGCVKAAEFDYLFYWVDAIFIKGEYLSEVKTYIESQGYEYKVKKIKKVVFASGKIVADGKEFSLPKRKIKR